MVVIGRNFLGTQDLLAAGIGACGENVLVHETSELVGAENIQIGDNVRIDPFCILAAANGTISLGSYIHIGASSFLAGGAGIEMADFSGLSQGVRIYSTTDDYLGGGLTNPTISPSYLNQIKGKVSIGKHVVIGSGAVVLPATQIHEGSSVGALSLVTKSLAPWGVYAGVPARLVKARRRDIIEALESKLLRETTELRNRV